MNRKQRRALKDPTRYAAAQPKKGDVVVHCGHLNESARKFTLYRYAKPIEVTRPDDSTFTTEWYARCGACEEANPDETPIRGDSIWSNDGPAVRR